MRRRLLAVIFLLLVIATACRNPFAPPEAGPARSGPLARQTDPDSTLANFRYAYERRDLDVYENCLASNFVFLYIDQDLTGQIEQVAVPRDGASGDLARTERLFRVFDAVSLDTWNVIAEPDDSTATGVVKRRRVNFHLSVQDLTGDFNFDEYQASGFARFTFEQSKTDNLWRIVTWEDQSFTQ